MNIAEITDEELETLSEAINALIEQRTSYDQDEGTENQLIDEAGNIIVRLQGMLKPK